MPSNKEKQQITSSRPAAAAATGPPARFLRGPWLALWVVLLLAAYATQAAKSMSDESPTFDENFHLPAGYSHLKGSDFRIMPEHPPLATMIAAFPLLFEHVDGGLDSDNWKNDANWYGTFLYGRGNDLPGMFFSGRVMMILLSMCLGLLIFHWARRLYGNAAGLLALFLFAFSPDFIGHGPLVATDVPAAFFMLLSLYCFDRASRRATPFSGALAGITLGLAVLTKFSALLMLPIIAVIALARVFDGERIDVRFWMRASFADGRRRKTVVLLILLGVMLLFAYVTLWAGYRFRFSASADGSLRSAWYETGRDKWLFRFLYDNRLVPESCLRGIVFQLDYANPPAFLDGQYNWTEHGAKAWPQYFVMTLLYKTPVPTLILFCVAVVMAFRWSRGSWRGEIPLIAAFAIYFGSAMFSKRYIGERYIFPVIPLMMIFAGKAATHLRAGRLPRNILPLAAFSLLVVWQIVGTVSVYPYYIAYFNEIAGGPANGGKHLGDSNIDWGQDLWRLRRYMAEHGIDKVRLSYFGTCHCGFHGVPSESLVERRADGTRWWAGVKEGDYVAISLTDLQEIYCVAPEQTAIIRTWKPMAVIGYTIYVYRAPRDIPPGIIDERAGRGGSLK